MDNYRTRRTLRSVISKIIVPCPFVQTRQGRVMQDKNDVCMESSVLFRRVYQNFQSVWWLSFHVIFVFIVKKIKRGTNIYSLGEIWLFISISFVKWNSPDSTLGLYSVTTHSNASNICILDHSVITVPLFLLIQSFIVCTSQHCNVKFAKDCDSNGHDKQDKQTHTLNPIAKLPPRTDQQRGFVLLPL